jgi:hypothetical protein
VEVGSSTLPGTTRKEEGGLAQLARAPALQAGGQRFESVILHKTRRTRKGTKGEKEIIDMLDKKNEKDYEERI